jgi:uncharacterized protein
MCLLLSISSASAVYDNNTTLNYTTLDQNVSGDVMKNPNIKTYLVNDSLTQEMVAGLKNGSIVYKLGNGNGKTIMICGGMHGDEPQGPLSVIKLLEYLKGQDINGTVYIVPFILPSTSAQNTRYYKGVDPNRVADVKGTPAYNIIQFALAHNVDYLMDIHSGYGVGSKGLVFYQTLSEKNLGAYIQSKTGCLLQSKPNEGTLRTTATASGINAITIEVEKSSLGVPGTVETEYKMLLNACAYLGLINKLPEPPKPAQPDLLIKSAQKKSKYIYVTLSQQGLSKTQMVSLKYKSGKTVKTVYFKFNGKSTITLKLYFPYKNIELFLDPKNIIKESNELNNYLKFT